MTPLELTLFGSPMIAIDGTPVNSRIDKAVALVALLALQGPTLDRDAIVSSLWTESAVSKAHAALRTAIWRLKSAGLDPWLDIERELIALKTGPGIHVDVVEFQSNLEQAKTHPHDPDSSCPGCSPMLRRAIELYRGDFMAGYSPRNAAGFDEWRTQYGNILKNDYLKALERLVKGYYKQGEYGQALQYCRRWLTIDQINEDAHHLIMRIYASNGQRANAIAQYRSYKHLLEKNLGIQPSEEITATYEQLLSGKNTPFYATEQLRNPILVLLNIDKLPELWIKHGNNIDQVLTRLARIIKENLRQCEGRLVQQNGDSYSIYFDRGQPLRCAIAIQRQITETQWGLPQPLSVRMVITTIPQDHTNPDEHAKIVYSCQHLIRAAASNQILLTDQAVRELEFPIASRTRNLGSYIIPGQINPAQVYELVHQHQPSAGTSYLQNLTRSPVNLPAQSTRFVGREAELKQLALLVSQPECRLLTLVGPGGVGKTRLGIQAVSQPDVSQPDGIYYVPLVLHRNPTTIYNPIAEALNLSFNNPGDKVAQLINYLRDKRMLLVLDNFEHLLAATPFLIALLESAPGLRLMLTSRERLNLHMETVFDVHGLPYPHDPDDPDFEQYSSVQLFTQNARRVSPGFTLHAEDRSAIIRICILVEGLPLGIELSSAWVRAFSCQEIADSIQQNLDFARTSSPDVSPRHRSLRAAFEHSWGLLSEEDRRTLGKLSIFRNGFSLHAAETLANATNIMLAAYVDKSMVVRQSSGRYLIPETLRSYVITSLQADPNEYERLLGVHSEYYIDILTGMTAKFSGESAGAAIKALELDADNIRAALNWAMDQHNWPGLLKSIDPLMSYYELQGRFRDGHDIAIAIMNRVINLVGMNQPHISYLLLGWDGWFSFRLGFTQEGLDKLLSMKEYVHRQGDFVHTATALMFMADAHSRLGDQTNALREIEQSLAIMEESFDLSVSSLLSMNGFAQTIYGLILFKLNRGVDARQVLNQSKSALTKSGSRYGLIRLLDVQSRLAKEDKRYEESLQLRLQALEIAEEFNDRRHIALLMNNIGESYEHLGDLHTAYSYAERSAQISSEIGDRQLSAVSNNNLGYITLQVHKRPADAILFYQKSLSMFREMDNVYGIFFTLRDISRAYVLTQSLDSARAHLVEALKIGAELNESLLTLHLLTVIAKLLACFDQPDRAIQLCNLCYNHPQTDPDLRAEAKLLMEELSDQIVAKIPDPLTGTGQTLPSFQDLIAEIGQGQKNNLASAEL